MLLDRDRSQLLIVDIQDRLLPHMDGAEDILKNAGILLAAAQDLGLPVTVSEQYRKGLGLTVAALRDKVPESDIFEKMHFSCAADPALARHVRHLASASGRDQLVIAGIESHVCVLQSAVGFQEAGLRVAVVMDAAGSRRAESKAVARDRFLAHGIETVTTEMALFEWLHRAGDDRFRRISKMIR